MVLRIILFGAPGSGKGTQAAMLNARYGLHHISTGDLFRKEMRSQSDLGLRAQSLVNSGKLVPDEIVAGMLRNALTSEVLRQGFILDGYPRTLNQAQILETMLEEKNLPLSEVFSLEVSESSLVQRLSGRRICPVCESSYHIRDFKGQALVCRKDGTRLLQRKDDEEAIIRTRLSAFEQQMATLKQFYRDLRSLVEIDGNPEAKTVFANICSVLENILNQSNGSGRRT